MGRPNTGPYSDKRKKVAPTVRTRVPARVCVQVEVDHLIRVLDLLTKHTDPIQDLTSEDIDMVLNLQRKVGIYARLQDGA